MLSSLGTRRARLLASALVVATLTVGCFSGTNESTGVPLPDSGLSREVFDLVNVDRAANGLPALSWHPQLGALAQGWSENMGSTGNFAHSDLNATIRNPEFDGFRRLGENILVGSCGMTAAAVEQAWMNSPGHRANILGDFNTIGVGFVCAGGRLWGTQNFGTV
ncbi:MAG: CAP domain-containing protein [Actinomycetota bacterium]